MWLFSDSRVAWLNYSPDDQREKVFFSQFYWEKKPLNFLSSSKILDLSCLVLLQNSVVRHSETFLLKLTNDSCEHTTKRPPLTFSLPVIESTEAACVLKTDLILCYGLVELPPADVNPAVIHQLGECLLAYTHMHAHTHKPIMARRGNNQGGFFLCEEAG